MRRYSRKILRKDTVWSAIDLLIILWVIFLEKNNKDDFIYSNMHVAVFGSIFWLSKIQLKYENNRSRAKAGECAI